MKRAEIKARVDELMRSGMAKQVVFEQVKGEGAREMQAALAVASYADPARCSRYRAHVRVLLAIMAFQVLMGLAIGWAVGSQIGPIARWVGAVLVMLIPLAFAWGFYSNRAGFYNAYIILSVLQLPNALGGLATDPIATGVAVTLSVAVIAYVAYVRTKLFPDFRFIGPRKVEGRYVFGG
jgi:uncharacterized membrane protein